MLLKKILLLALASLVTGQAMSQSYISTNGRKYTLVEEATGTWCGWCPDGAQVIEQSIEPNFPRAIIASWHSADAMQLPGDPFGTGSGYITAYPMGTINRKTWSGIVGQNRDLWEGDVISDSGTVPKFDVTLACGYNSASRLLTVSVTGKALSTLTGQWNLNAYIVEDSIPSTGANAQDSYLNSVLTCANGMPSWFTGLGSPITPSSSYAHMNVVNAVLATGGSIWGDSAFVDPAVNTMVTKTYTYYVPISSNPARVKVIGMVQKFAPFTTDRAIENCILARVRWMGLPNPALGMETHSLQNVMVTPNPANGYINITATTANSGATKVVISNILGRIVFEQNYSVSGNDLNVQIPLAGMESGVYFIRLISNNEVTGREFVVEK